MTQCDTYAPIADFELVAASPASGAIAGFAKPVKGIKPCALALVAGSTVISTAAASDFSLEAKRRSLRHGWCGFVISGFSQAVATDDTIELRCLISDQVQKRWHSAELIENLTMVQPGHLSVGDMVANIRRARSCQDIDHVLPFALSLARRSGARSFLDATFLYLLGRLPDPSAIINFDDNYSTADAVRRCWNDIIVSPEYRQRNRLGVTSPFDPGFPFPLDLLDQAAEHIML